MALQSFSEKELKQFRGVHMFDARSSKTVKEIMGDPDILLQEGRKYFLWCVANPLEKCEAIKSGDNCGKLVTIPMMRVFTLVGLCRYLNMSESYFRKWKYDLKQREKPTTKQNAIVTVLSLFEEVIYQQKFEGAASNLFNANLIARDLGINDTQNIHHMGNTDDSPIQMTINVHDTKAGIKTDENE